MLQAGEQGTAKRDTFQVTQVGSGGVGWDCKPAGLLPEPMLLTTVLHCRPDVGIIMCPSRC